MSREKLTAQLRPLVERLHRGHHWKKTKDGPRMIGEPFTAVHLSEHVMGGAAYGLCPIAPGSSSTRVACLDLDSHKGEVPFERMVEIANNIALSLEIDGHKPHIFKSSGGAGIHIYLLWQREQDAFSVRTMLAKILSEHDLKPGAHGIAKNEVEIFPKQDEVKSDGYGSMFILPWSGQSIPIGEFTAWRGSADVPLCKREERVVSSAASGVEGYATLKSALDFIPNGLHGAEELSYDEWRNIIFAIHHATEGEAGGLSLAHEISARSSKYDPEFLDNRVWPYIRQNRDGATITARTIYSKASDLGWQDPALADDFDVVEVAQPPETAAPGVAAAGQAPDTPARFNLVHASLFAVARALTWIVKGVLPDADLAVVFGESGSGKSFWVLDLILAICRGIPWQGRKTTKGRCVYVAAEGVGGFRNRLKAYMIEHKIDAPDLFILPDAPSFLDAKHVKEVILNIKALGRVSVVAVDTLAQVSPGGAENSSEDMGKIIMHCRMIRKKTGATVMLIHHAGKDSTKGARGWSGLRAAADTEIEIVRVKHDRVATITKQKDGSDGDEFGFKLRTVEIGRDEDDVVLTSCVVDHGAAVAADRRKMVPLKTNEIAVIETLRTLQEVDGDNVLTSVWIAATNMDALERTVDKDVGQANRAARRARDSVVEKGQVLLTGNFVRVGHE